MKRGDTLLELKDMLEENHITVLCGTSGCGKSALFAEYYWSVNRRFQNVCVFDLEEADEFDAQTILQCAKKHRSDTLIVLDHLIVGPNTKAAIACFRSSGMHVLAMTHICGEVISKKLSVDQDQILNIDLENSRYSEEFLLKLLHVDLDFYDIPQDENFDVDTWGNVKFYRDDFPGHVRSLIALLGHNEMLLTMVGRQLRKSGYYKTSVAEFLSEIEKIGLYEAVKNLLPEDDLCELKSRFYDPLVNAHMEPTSLEAQVLMLSVLHKQMDPYMEFDLELSTICRIIGDTDTVHLARDAAWRLAKAGFLDLMLLEGDTYLHVHGPIAMYAETIYGLPPDDCLRVWMANLHRTEPYNADSEITAVISERSFLRKHDGDYGDIDQVVRAAWEQNCATFQDIISNQELRMLSLNEPCFVVEFSNQSNLTWELRIASLDGTRSMAVLAGPNKQIPNYFPEQHYITEHTYDSCRILSLNSSSLRLDDLENICEWKNGGLKDVKFRELGQELLIPNVICGCPVIELGDEAFSYTNIRKIVLPNRLERIGKSCFAYCERLEEINFPSTIKEIGNDAFWMCKRLREIKIPPMQAK